MDRFRTTMIVLVLCGITLYVIIYTYPSVNQTDNEVKYFPPYECTHLPDEYRTGNDSIRLPLCGIGYESFVFNISSGEKIRGVKTIYRDTPKHLCRSSFRARDSMIFSMRERLNYNKCRKENSNVFKVRQMNFKYLQDIRLEFFHHLKNKKRSSVIEIGGYKGALTKSFLTKYKIQNYVVVEPIKTNTEYILNTTQSLQRTDVGVYQFALGKEYTEISLNDDRDSTSLLWSIPKNSTRNKTVQVIHAIDFFLLLGVACHDIDLLTINCEGCEFDVLEMLVSTNLIDRFVHIQFQPHCLTEELFGFGDSSCRYCRIHQFLYRTHEIAYRFSHIWEAWRRKPRW